MGPYAYRVTATGHGSAFITYPIRLKMLSNYDYDKGDEKGEVIKQAGNRACACGCFTYISDLRVSKLHKEVK